MGRQFRVITLCYSQRLGGLGVFCETDWLSYRACRKYILGRWGHYPPWAFISSIADYDKLQRKYGD